jgi:hypothetical protein
MITSRDYCTALSVLDERDLYEVLSVFHDALSFLIEEEVNRKHAREWAYTHPLTRIYTERAMQLTGVGPGPAQSWRTSYQFARKAAANHAASCALCGIHYRFTPAEPDNERYV